jgi:hypothetical protein
MLIYSDSAALVTLLLGLQLLCNLHRIQSSHSFVENSSEYLTKSYSTSK